MPDQMILDSNDERWFSDADEDASAAGGDGGLPLKLGRTLTGALTQHIWTSRQESVDHLPSLCMQSFVDGCMNAHCSLSISSVGVAAQQPSSICQPLAPARSHVIHPCMLQSRRWAAWSTCGRASTAGRTSGRWATLRPGP